VDASAADVRDLCGQARSELTLNVEVPLHHNSLRAGFGSR